MQRVVPLKVCVLNPSYLKGPEAYIYIYICIYTKVYRAMSAQPI